LKIVLGLGNPGDAYRNTRHNVGFRVLDLLAERAGVRFESRGELGRKAWHAEAELGGVSVVLGKPRTFMNRSGAAALALARRSCASPEEILVVFDDADLALGRVRVRPEGGAGGHNGLRSIIDTLGSSAFPRVKLGIRGAGRDEEDLADYVLTGFDADEREVLEGMLSRGADAVEWVLRHGVASAMQEFNGKPGNGGIGTSAGRMLPSGGSTG
jgi:PTH1 family peptidyl-tRNA hydrolase